MYIIRYQKCALSSEAGIAITVLQSSWLRFSLFTLLFCFESPHIHGCAKSHTRMDGFGARVAVTMLQKMRKSGATKLSGDW